MTLQELENALTECKRKGIVDKNTEVGVKIIPSMETYEADDLSLEVKNGVLTFVCQR